MKKSYLLIILALLIIGGCGGKEEVKNCSELYPGITIDEHCNSADSECSQDYPVSCQISDSNYCCPEKIEELACQTNIPEGACKPISTNNPEECSNVILMQAYAGTENVIKFCFFEGGAPHCCLRDQDENKIPSCEPQDRINIWYDIRGYTEDNPCNPELNERICTHGSNLFCKIDHKNPDYIKESCNLETVSEGLCIPLDEDNSNYQEKVCPSDYYPCKIDLLKTEGYIKTQCCPTDEYLQELEEANKLDLPYCVDIFSNIPENSCALFEPDSHLEDFTNCQKDGTAFWCLSDCSDLGFLRSSCSSEYIITKIDESELTRCYFLDYKDENLAEWIFCDDNRIFNPQKARMLNYMEKCNKDEFFDNFPNGAIKYDWPERFLDDYTLCYKTTSTDQIEKWYLSSCIELGFVEEDCSYELTDQTEEEFTMCYINNGPFKNNIFYCPDPYHNNPNDNEEFLGAGGY